MDNNFTCGVCGAKNYKKFSEMLYICVDCSHVFSDIKYNEEVKINHVDGKMKIEIFISDNLLEKYEKDSVSQVEIYQTLEYIKHPQAFLHDLYRVCSEGCEGTIYLQKGGAFKNYFSSDKVAQMLKISGFEVEKINFFKKLANIVNKKIIIKFKK